MKLEPLNLNLFEQMSFDQMSSIQGGNNSVIDQGGGTTLCCIHVTGSCGCTDADDID